MARINLNLSCMRNQSRSLRSVLSCKSVLFNSSGIKRCDTINDINYFSKNTLYTSGVLSYWYVSLNLSSSLFKSTKKVNECHLRYLHHIMDQKDPVPFVSLTHIKNVLTLRKVDVIDGFTCLIIKCPFCANPKKSEMFINKVTGFVICNGCRRSGKWLDVEDFFKKNKSVPVEYLNLKKYSNDASAQWKELCKTAVPYTSLGFDEKTLLCRKLHLEELPGDLFEHLNVHVEKDLSSIYVPLKYASNSEIVGYKIIKLTQGNNSVKEEDQQMVVNDANEITEPIHNCRGILLHKSKNSKKDQAVLVSDFKDFISLAQLTLNYYVICLPHGLTNLPQEVLPILERYRKIVLWFGNDTYCWDAARQFAKKLGDKRCYFVRPVKENPPPHVIAADKNSIGELKRIVESAEPISHPAVISFSSLRQDVISELQNIDKAQGVMWQRFPGLNSLLKGFRRGELSIFTGPTGSGKTTFLSEYSLDLLMQGVPTLWGSFEVRNQRLARTMLQQYVQLPLDLYPEKLNYWADRFERLPLYFMTFHGQQPLKKVLEAVEHASYVHDIAHVIIDNVQFMLGMLDTETNLDRFYRQDALIGSFRNFATVSNCHVTLVIHPRKERDAEQLNINSVFGGAKASQEADNVFIIQQKMLQSLKIKKYLQVAKNRFSGDLGLIPLDFDKETLSFSTKNDKKQKKSDSNNINKDEDLTKEMSNIEDLHLLQ